MIVVPLKVLKEWANRNPQTGKPSTAVPVGVPVPDDAIERDFSYKNMLAELVGTANGVSLGNLARIQLGFKVLDKLEALPADATSIEFEDAEYTLVKERVDPEKVGYASLSRSIRQFLDDVLKAGDPKPEPPVAPKAFPETKLVPAVDTKETPDGPSAAV